MPSKLYYKNMNAAKHSLIFQSYNVALHRGINLCFYSQTDIYTMQMTEIISDVLSIKQIVPITHLYL